MTRSNYTAGSPIDAGVTTVALNRLGPIAAGLLAEIGEALGHDVVQAREGLRRLDAVFRLLPIWPAGTNAAPVPSRRWIGPGGLAPWQLIRVDAVIADRMEHPLYVQDLATHVRLSQSHFCRAFKNSTGETPHAYIMGKRLERACRLMLESDESLSRIASTCGLADQAHLSRLFRRRFGMTPWRWRRERKGEDRTVPLPVEALDPHVFSGRRVAQLLQTVPFACATSGQ